MIKCKLYTAEDGIIPPWSFNRFKTGDMVTFMTMDSEIFNGVIKDHVPNLDLRINYVHHGTFRTRSSKDCLWLLRMPDGGRCPIPFGDVPVGAGRPAYARRMQP